MGRVCGKSTPLKYIPLPTREARFQRGKITTPLTPIPFTTLSEYTLNGTEDSKRCESIVILRGRQGEKRENWEHLPKIYEPG